MPPVGQVIGRVQLNVGRNKMSKLTFEENEIMGITEEELAELKRVAEEVYGKQNIEVNTK